MQFKSGSGGGSNPHIIQLKSGDTVQGILRGEPLEYEHAFKPGDKPAFKFQLNIIVKENGAYVAKILRGGWKLYSQLRELNAGGWNLEETVIKVSRHGSGLNDTVYSATPSPTPPSAEVLAQVKQVQLRVLAAPNQPTREPGSDDGDPGPQEERF